MLDFTNVTIAGKPAYKVDATANGPVPRGIQYFMVDGENNTAYYMACAMLEEYYTDYEPTCQKMANSIEIVE